MKKLETKYRNDELSPAELQELRNRIKSMSDYEIGEEMYQTWMNEKIECHFRSRQTNRQNKGTD